ncbi:Uncharacterized conserved protein, DUF427 family [Methanococcoides vulcani]|uniref:Uncharacterized conserved protein, DUF427 family n=1 Tax=Methanococcoides vulcani TaxID=1353158 RepID=A0A1H9ZFY8_9EURY|nr:DUF427 domain-containing protein [Methanococcoides vulcani]SES80444.1 Uncharacterized conserved protein, DUF427 family [Methanococcoides vulcani]
MTVAKWNGAILAESDAVKEVEGNLYFPPDSVNREYLRESDTRSTCPWKGLAYYYDIVVGDDVNKDAAWNYPDSKPAAKEITGYVAFWKGVEVTS